MTIPDPEPNAECPIVGIGASAGGLEALHSLIPAVEPQSGIAYVVVQHLDPDRHSALATLLARHSRIPVSQIEQRTAVEANHVYVIPPNATLTLDAGHLVLTSPEEPRGQRTPIDSFLVSLAAARRERAACVILSGTGSDGTIGLRAIKEHGGLTLAQAGAEYDGMMRSALATGLVDFVLPAAEIPPRLAGYFDGARAADGKKGPDGVLPDLRDSLTQIGTLLRARTGHDFSGYKDKTLARRVQRRMHVLQIDELPQFVERLRKDPRQVDLLFQDLLIGVTHFFRDQAAFEALEREVIPRLLEGKGPDDTVRVWVPGCSTGEEAYSIAILLRERTADTRAAPRLQVFASDIDEHALQIARAGRYPAAAAKDIAPKRLERYFLREDGTYRITGDLREMCLFSVRNLLRDAPFSKLDLISCRNLLIYLDAELQSRVVPLFHYALLDSGYLFLGASENVTQHPRLFATVDKAHRIFKKRPTADRKFPPFPLAMPDPSARRSPQIGAPAAYEAGIQAIAEHLLLERYAPAYVVINGDGEVLHASARTGKYLELPVGAPKTDIFSMARRGLRPDLRGVIHKAVGTGQATIQGGVAIGTNGGRQVINLVVQPLRAASAEDRLYMVIFQDVGGIETEAEGDAEEEGDRESATLQQLETELRATRDRLQATTEELESSNEELKAGNEELSSMNEELQSANEELETSKEELQSINEELQTVNSELNARVEELSRANSDIANLLESTQIATVFLDRHLVVTSFTPAAKDLFRLVESDAGRPLTHVRALFVPDTVQEDAERVLRTLATIEREVGGADGAARYVMRIMPYRTVDNVISGVVITFGDVTKMAAAEARISALSRELRDRVESLETLLDLVPVGILIAGADEKEPVEVNRYGALLLGGSGADKEGPRRLPQPVRLFAGERELEALKQPLERAARAGETVTGFEGRLARRDGSSAEVAMSATPLFDESGKVRGAIATMLDISDRKDGDARQTLLLHELQHRVKNILATIDALAARLLKSSPSIEEFTQAFRARLQAMGAMHVLLSERQWQGADLRALAARILAPYKADVRLDGPGLVLQSSIAATLGMVLFELATNAVKYGALSTEKGTVAVTWQVERKAKRESARRRLSLRWSERGGPPVAPPEKEGFGTSFVRRSIEYDLGGTVTLDFSASGLDCLIAVPLPEGAAAEPSRGTDVATGDG